MGDMCRLAGPTAAIAGGNVLPVGWGQEGCIMARSVKSQELGGTELLAALDQEALDALANRCGWKAYDKGEQILSRDSDSGEVYFVVDGEVGVVNFSLGGREIAYTSIGDGNYFGEMAAIDGEPRSATVIAKKACVLASLPSSAFLDLLAEHPSVALGVMRKLSRIIRISDDRIMDLSTLGAQARVCRELMRMADEEDTENSTVVEALPTQTDVAARVGTTRETVARTLSQLSTAGLIEREGKRLEIVDRDALEDLADHLGGDGF